MGGRTSCQVLGRLGSGYPVGPEVDGVLKYSVETTRALIAGAGRGTLIRDVVPTPGPYPNPFWRASCSLASCSVYVTANRVVPVFFTTVK